MANRVPLIINTTANQIQELALGDCLDLTASGIHNAGVITATKFVGDGSLLTNVSGGGGGTSGISDIVDDTIRYLKPLGCKTVWMQIGIKNEMAALKARKKGMSVIMDKCPKIENQRLFGELRVAGFNTGIISSKIDFMANLRILL